MSFFLWLGPYMVCILFHIFSNFDITQISNFLYKYIYLIGKIKTSFASLSVDLSDPPMRECTIAT